MRGAFLILIPAILAAGCTPLPGPTAQPATTQSTAIVQPRPVQQRPARPAPEPIPVQSPAPPILPDVGGGDGGGGWGG